MKRNPSTDMHHYYTPKSLYKDNIITEENYDFHHGFHGYFDHFCKDPKERYCTGCPYRRICCYCERLEWYGVKLT